MVINLDPELKQILNHIGKDEAVRREQMPDGTSVLHFEMTVGQPRDKYGLNVRSKEPVKLVFQKSYPTRAPKPYLREDFPRGVAHIQPAQTDEELAPQPCVVDEALDDYFATKGMPGLLDQLQVWLDNAAFGTLRSKDSFWEASRRDGVRFSLIMDLEKLNNSVNSTKGSLVRAAMLTEDETGSLFALADDENISVRQLTRLLEAKDIRSNVIVTWPNKNKISDAALFDEPQTLEDLLSTANSLGMKRVAKEIDEIANTLGSTGSQSVLFLVLAIRRPATVFKSGQDDCDIEFVAVTTLISPKELHVGRKTLFTADRSEKCYATQIIDVLSQAKQQDISNKSYSKSQNLFLAGCGSVGSKIGIHLAKSGFGDITLCDKAFFRPHHSVRMGVVAGRRLAAKAELVKLELNKLGHTPSTESDILDLEADGALTLPPETTLILDTTASPAVHNMLVRSTISPSSCRISCSYLFAEGRIGLFGLEGIDRQADLHDIHALFWSFWMNTDDKIRATSWGGFDKLDRINIGVGCGSMSMRLSDANTSLLVAGFANYLSDLMEQDVIEERAQISIARSDGYNVNWANLDASGFDVLKSDSGWKITISRDVSAKIENETNTYRPKETGGYLLGHINKNTRRISITDLLDAPPDSTRSENYFKLGVEGAKDDLLDLYDASLRGIQALGTWHSHPNGGNESQTDRETLKSIAQDMAGEPALLLIWRPEGFKLIMKDNY